GRTAVSCPHGSCVYSLGRGGRSRACRTSPASARRRPGTRRCGGPPSLGHPRPHGIGADLGPGQGVGRDAGRTPGGGCRAHVTPEEGTDQRPFISAELARRSGRMVCSHRKAGGAPFGDSIRTAKKTVVLKGR